MISLLTLNSRVMTDSTETTFDLVNKQHLDGVRQLINNDFSRIGFGDNAEITQFHPDSIEFKADIDGSGTQTVKWAYRDDSPVTGTRNPDDYRLVRKANGKTLKMRAVDFNLTGYTKVNGGTETTTAGEVKSILVEIVYASAEPSGKMGDGTDIYPESVWRKLIVPNNLQFKTVIKN